MSWYCDVAPGDPVHGPYHDREYGFPLSGERALFERLCLEIFQAGLTWRLILERRPGLKAAFDDFEVDTVAAYEEAELARLLADPRIIRNRLKVTAIIENARRVRALRATHGGFAPWIAAHHPSEKEGWIKLFRENFKFMGPEIVGEFLMSIGYLPGAHREDCPVFARIKELDPPWMKAVPPNTPER